ncbi:MAG: caspase family protein [Byssovorax sp.]
MPTFEPWSSTSALAGTFPPGAIVTAVSRDDGHIHLVAAGVDGGIWTTFYDDNRPGSAWTPWTRVGAPALVNVPPNLGPTALARLTTRLDLFTISSDRTLWTVAWDPQAGEAGDWHPIWTLPLFAPGTALSAVSPSRDRMHVLAIGSKGEVWSVTWDVAGTPTKWGAYTQLSDRAFVNVSSRQRVAVALRAPDRLDIFIVSKQGRVVTTSSEGGATWSAWSTIHEETAFAPDALITAVARDADGLGLELFVPGADGGVWTSALRAGATWTAWARIGAAGLLAAPSHLAVTAIATAPGAIELFVTGKSGAVLANASLAGGGWGEWTAAGAPSGSIPAQSIVAAISCRPGRLDLFAVGDDGLIHAARRAASLPVAAEPAPLVDAGRGLSPADLLRRNQRAAKPVTAIRKRHALLVGVDRYDNGDACPSLQFCVADVLALRETLRKIGYEEPIVLYDDAPEERLLPTRANILRELTALTGSLDPADLLLVHFSCHGTRIGGDAYLLPRTAQLNDLRGTALAVAEIRQIVEAGPALERVLFFDACHVGADVGRAVQGATLTPDFVRNVFEQAVGTRVLSGSTAQQIAHEQSEQQHGVFTGFVLAGLSGLADREAKGFVTFDDLRDYVVNGVVQWSRDHSFSLQQPVSDGPSTGDMILAGAVKPP